jgi:hypothetical protein
VQFLVNKRVPSAIVDLPERVFSTPMGQMIRPMIEAQQNQMRGSIPGFQSPSPPTVRPTTSSTSAVRPNPWANNTAASTSSQSGTRPNPWVNNTTSAASTSSQSGTRPNPWANNPSSAASSSSSQEAPSSNPWANNTQETTSSAQSRAAAVEAAISQSQLFLNLKPLLSSSTAIVPGVLRQLRELALSNGTSNSLSPTDDALLSRLGDSLTSTSSTVPTQSFKLIHNVKR